MKNRIRMINKPVFDELNSFIHDKNAKANHKKELVFDYPPIKFENAIEKLIENNAD
jgi:hypothetical protein